MSTLDFDVAIIGAGIAGIYAVHHFRDTLGLSVRAFEEAPDVGGVWYSNRYPGARVDLEARDYSYHFSPELRQEWQWSQLFPSQPEILSYLNHVADRFDVRHSITFDTRVEELTWDANRAGWRVGTSDGGTHTARFVVTATGNLSAPKPVDIPGVADFAGRMLATYAWPHTDVDFTNQRVGVIGTGTSGAQVIPRLAEKAGHLTVFQRTPAYAIPILNRPTTWAERQETPEDFAFIQELTAASPGGEAYEPPLPSALEVEPEVRREIYDRLYAGGGFRLLGSFDDLLTDPAANETLAQYIRDRIGERVHNAETALRLTPIDYPCGARRVVMEDGYYEAFNRDDVTLIDLRATPIRTVVPEGVRTEDGQLHPLDTLVLATGFDACTGSLTRMRITGRNGSTLAGKWSTGAAAFLGVASHGFPNLFMVGGPLTPDAYANNFVTSEKHVEFIGATLQHVLQQGHTTIEAELEAEQTWSSKVDAIAAQTLVPRTNSWLNGANVPGKPRTVLAWLAGVPAYRRAVAEVVRDSYRGFQLT
ncbi:flavin-containing monooxygenase [Streptomyces sioyaensis]|uniref:flavin-containing monooxygenase n=1 Tax=Streptomyces sioyaensis TaxID=67364 RepID=UPI0037D47244